MERTKLKADFNKGLNRLIRFTMEKYEAAGLEAIDYLHDCAEVWSKWNDFWIRCFLQSEDLTERMIGDMESAKGKGDYFL